MGDTPGPLRRRPWRASELPEPFHVMRTVRSGRTIRARIVRAGQRYGDTAVLPVGARPLVELRSGNRLDDISDSPGRIAGVYLLATLLGESATVWVAFDAGMPHAVPAGEWRRFLDAARMHVHAGGRVEDETAAATGR